MACVEPGRVPVLLAVALCGHRLALSRSRRGRASVGRRRAAARRAVTPCCDPARRGSSRSGALPPSSLGLYARWARHRANDGRAAARARRRAVRISRDGDRDRRRPPGLAARRARPRGATPGRVPAGVPRRRLGRSAGATPPRRRAGRRSSSRPSSRPARCSTSCTRCCPDDDSGLLHSLTPDAVGPLAHAAGVLVGGRAARRGARPRTPATACLAGRDRARTRSRPCSTCCTA